MSAEGLNGTATAWDVGHCYRVLLGREAESETVIEEKVGRRRMEVLDAFVTSGEFGAQILYRLIDGLPPATRLHEKPAEPGAADWAAEFFGADEGRAERLRRADSGLGVLAAVATTPAFLSILEGRFGSEATAAFDAAVQSHAIKLLRQTAPDDVALTLKCGSMLLGSLGRAGPRPDRPLASLDIWDFGLADFARLSRLDGFAITTAPREGTESDYPLPVPRAAAASEPLASRRWLAPQLRLADLWFTNRREIALRYEGNGARLTLDVYQCPVGDRPVKLVATAPIGHAVAIVPVKLFNPLAPVLLVIRDPSGAIRMFDHIPFPSLARGGLHGAERAICGNGGDDVSDMALVSAELLALLLARGETVDRTVAVVDIDPAADKGIEPMFDSDLLEYLTRYLGMAVAASAPGAMADQLARFTPEAPRRGPTLLLPADAVPSLSALIRPIPPHTATQTVTGSLGIMDWDRQGSVHSLWTPPIGDWLDDLQWRVAKRGAPMLRIGDGAGPAELCLGWPLALAIRPAPLKQSSRSPFEIAAEVDLPLLRKSDDGTPSGLDIVVLFDTRQVSPLPLLETIVRQQAAGDTGAVLLCRPVGTADPAIVDALEGLFPGRGRIVELRAGAGRLDQLMAVRAELTQEFVLIVDAATLLTDRRTVATLATILSVDRVASAGCLIRHVEGDRRIASHGGYGLTHADLRATPSLAFSPMDIEALGGPVTLPVAANTMAATLMKRSLIEALPPQGSDGGRPAEDDILLGLAALDSGGLNLCTSVVSAHSERPAPSKLLLGRALPYRLDARMIDRLINAAVVVQRIR